MGKYSNTGIEADGKAGGSNGDGVRDGANNADNANNARNAKSSSKIRRGEISISVSSDFMSDV